VGVVRQVLPDFLHSVVRRAVASARAELRQAAAQPLLSVMEPDAHSLAARARPAVENREMA
jgi:type II secretory pathway component PulJ